MMPDISVNKVAIQRDNEEGRFWNRYDRRLWLLAMFCGCSMLYASRTVMPLCSVSIANELGYDKAESGTILSAFFWGYTMTQIIGGYFSDRIGGEVVLCIAAVGWTLVTFWTPCIAYVFSDKNTELGLLVFSRVVVGCFQGVHFPSVASLFSRRVPEEERAYSFAVATSGAHFGTLLTGGLGSVFLMKFGWHSCFYFIGLLSACWVLAVRYGLVKSERQRPAVVSLRDNITNTNGTEPVPWLTLLTKGPFWGMIIGHGCHAGVTFLLLSWMPTFFVENYPDAKGWVYNVVPWLATIPVSVGSGWLADSLVGRGMSVTSVRKTMQSISFLGAGISLFGLTVLKYYYAALLLVTVAIAAGGFHISGILVNPQDIAPKFSGSVFGLMNTMGSVVGFVSVYLAGHTLKHTRSWDYVFQQASAMSFVGWAVYCFLGTGKRVV